MTKYRVLKDGISQRQGNELVERLVGEVIEVSEVAAPGLIAEGYIEPVAGSGGRKPRRTGQIGPEEAEAD